MKDKEILRLQTKLEKMQKTEEKAAAKKPAAKKPAKKAPAKKEEKA